MTKTNHTLYANSSYYSFNKKAISNVNYRFYCEHCHQLNKKTVTYQTQEFLNTNTKKISQREIEQLEYTTITSLRSKLRQAKRLIDQGIYPLEYNSKCEDCHSIQSWGLSFYKNKPLKVGTIFTLIAIISILLIQSIANDKLALLFIFSFLFVAFALGFLITCIYIRLRLGKIRWVKEKDTPTIDWPEDM